MSDLRVGIKDEPWRRGVAIYVTRGDDRSLEILHIVESGGVGTVYQWNQISEGVEVPPTLELADNIAPLLLDALVRHYQGAEDTRSLRKDYDAERARVDKFIDVLTERVWTVAQSSEPTP